MFLIQGFSGKFAVLNGLIFEEVAFPEVLIEVCGGEVVDVAFVQERVYLLSPLSIKEACARVNRNFDECEVLRELIARSDDFVFGISHVFCVRLAV